MKFVKIQVLLLGAAVLFAGIGNAMIVPMEIDSEIKIDLPTAHELVERMQKSQLAGITEEVTLIDACASKKMSLYEIVQVAINCIDVYEICIKKGPFSVQNAWKKIEPTGIVMYKLLAVLLQDYPDYMAQALSLAFQRRRVSAMLLSQLCYEMPSLRNFFRFTPDDSDDDCEMSVVGK